MFKKSAFTASYLTPDESAGTPETASAEVRTFKMEDFLASSGKQRDFSYDSESARNFDQGNVKKAKDGVLEIIADAIQKAKTRAVEIKTQAQKEGYDAGYAAGFQKGEDEAKKEFSPFLETIQELIQTLSLFREKMYPKVEREMIEMVIQLAKKVIHYELSTREDSVQEMIQLAVQSVLDKESMIIKINPDDKGYAESFRPELHQLFGDIKNITFEAHSGIERGGCMIETNFGTIDARLEKLDEQIDKILNLAPPPVEDDLPNREMPPAENESPEPEKPSAEDEIVKPEELSAKDEPVKSEGIPAEDELVGPADDEEEPLPSPEES